MVTLFIMLMVTVHANDNSSSMKTLSSSYQLKSGERPGDGDSAPCGPYTGVYSADYEYVEESRRSR